MAVMVKCSLYLLDYLVSERAGTRPDVVALRCPLPVYNNNIHIAISCWLQPHLVLPMIARQIRLIHVIYKAKKNQSVIGLLGSLILESCQLNEQERVTYRISCHTEKRLYRIKVSLIDNDNMFNSN